MTGGLERARAALESAGRVFVLTGAGVSAESGVPTFRGSGGLWKSHRPEDLATPRAFRRDPRLVWEWYGWRRALVSECSPNPAHRALAAWAHRRGGVRIVTQNVDGLHTLAARSDGGEGALPLELHGSLFRVRCTACDRRLEHRHPVDASSPDSLPRCSDCGALLRPDVVWFGESLDPDVLEEAAEAARGADLALVVGTSAVVEPAASLPRVTASTGGVVVEVNTDETALTRIADASLRGAAGTVLPRLLGVESV